MPLRGARQWSGGVGMRGRGRGGPAPRSTRALCSAERLTVLPRAAQHLRLGGRKCVCLGPPPTLPLHSTPIRDSSNQEQAHHALCPGERPRTWKWPFWQARWSGTAWFTFRAPALAPCFNRRGMRSARPCRAATCSGEEPSWLVTFTPSPLAGIFASF